MKNEELMIGDWVMVAGTPMRVACIGTNRIGFKDSNGEIFFHDADNVKAIQMSDEILEKNGWERDAQEGLSFNNSEYCYIVERSRFNESEYRIGEYDLILTLKEPNDVIFKSITKVCEVHTFQHALKVLGIKQEICLIETK